MSTTCNKAITRKKTLFRGGRSKTIFWSNGDDIQVMHVYAVQVKKKLYTQIHTQ